VLAELGMAPATSAAPPPSLPRHLTVMLDGRLVGSVAAPIAPHLVDRLRLIKAARLAATDRSGQLPIDVSAVVSLEVRDLCVSV